MTFRVAEDGPLRDVHVARNLALANSSRQSRFNLVPYFYRNFSAHARNVPSTCAVTKPSIGTGAGAYSASDHDLPEGYVQKERLGGVIGLIAAVVLMGCATAEFTPLTTRASPDITCSFRSRRS